MKNRKYLPTLSELIDRLSIAQLKEVFINEHKDEYSKEILDIINDIQILLDETDNKIDAKTNAIDKNNFLCLKQDSQNELIELNINPNK